MNQKYLGTSQQAIVKKKITNGFVVNVFEDEVTLPDESVTEDIELDQEIEVFLYLDKKGRLTATMEEPHVSRDSYGWAEVQEVVPHMGVFVDIGLEGKEMLVSSDDLPLLKSVWPQNGDNLFVSLEVDKKGRLLAEPISEEEVMDDLERAPETLMGEEVVARVYKATKAGSAVLTGDGHRGFIHPTERKEEPRLGQTVEARVIAVKEDGTLNLSLRPLKQESRKEDAEVIYDYLVENDGVMDFHDKSDPEEIRETFQISKGAFKRALGKLLKENRVEQKEGRTVIKHDS
ncbi:CvfB family protein [Halobacillus salinus]|uniref:CvfB family protein n=1 Tax=Halobacillus salinus TaxID=192814 RepID=UPI0009A84660|nr:S1-like domain-containing RNA-binding protein [Halobacillus salinus]